MSIGTNPSLRLANSLSTQNVRSSRARRRKSDSLVTASRSASDSRMANA
ncbi:Uncharacterised protein [Mycobacteroides abscessus subsp. abscessus]|nr:Uncharacterised protein [Mycobacteroides abscessus subsp. abscessus]